MPVSRRAFLGTSGAIGAGTLLAGSLAAQTAAADPIAAAGNPVPRPAARNSLRMRTGQPGLQWVTYGYNLPNNANIPEDVWKKNIDWVIREFAPYGYDTICTDGWIESSQRSTRTATSSPRTTSGPTTSRTGSTTSPDTT